jgi:hypothetical protein
MVSSNVKFDPFATYRNLKGLQTLCGKRVRIDTLPECMWKFAVWIKQMIARLAFSRGEFCSRDGLCGSIREWSFWLLVHLHIARQIFNITGTTMME